MYSAWLSIIASKNSGEEVVSVADIVKDHWKRYGRNFYCRYDYESVSSDGANKMMNHLRHRIAELKEGATFGGFATPIKYADEFEYKDPVDGSISSRQGLRFVFVDGSRVIIRLSGTGSVGATIRLYLEQYEPDVDNHAKDTLVCPAFFAAK